MSLITTGHGYPNGQPPYVMAPDPIFTDYKVVFHPLPGRDSRVIHNTCYRAYDIRLAIRSGERIGDSLYLLINHGGGSETWKLDFRSQLLPIFQNMPEVDAYYTLWKLWDMSADARRDAISATATRYSEAFIEGRLKKGRVKQGRRRVTIEPRPAPQVADQPLQINLA